MTTAAVKKAYGFAFPVDMERFWAIAKKHGDALFEAHVRLVGPFTLHRGGKPSPDLDRWPADPPELFTVAEGDTDGLHWGYVLHEPGRAPGHVASFYSRAGYPIEPAGPTLLHAMRDHVEAVASDVRGELAEIRAVGENDSKLARALARIDALAAALRATTGEHVGASGGKKFCAPKELVDSKDGLGVRAPKAVFAAPRLDRSKLERELRKPSSRDAWLARGHAFIANKKAGTALQIARDALAVLPTADQDGAVLLAVAAYDALGRPLLARTFARRVKEIQKRAKTPAAPKIDNRFSRSMEEALQDPSKVERLLLERWRGQPKTPDLDVIATFSNLSVLVLRCYPLGDLPSSFAKLKSLREIELFECALTTLPKVLAKLPKLERLDIIQDSGGRVPRVPLAVPRGLAFPKLTALKLVACGLTEVPAFVLACKELFKLSLNGNRLTELPDQIGGLTKLGYLSVVDNALTTLPESMSKLKKLWSLWLRNNRIAALPEAIGALPLKSIDVAKNPLAKNKAERARTKKLLKKASIYWA